MPESAYADAELLLRRYLAAAFPTATVTVETDNDLADNLPVIRLSRIGGGERQRSLDIASIDIDCFAETRLAVNEFANQVRTALERGGPGYTDPALRVSISALSVQNFGWRPYVNTNVRSAGMTADVTLHNHR